MFHRKNHTVSIRVSEQEYDALRQFSEASGAPSVSDYMRSRIFEAPAADSRNHDSIDNLASGLAELRSRFERLCAHVGLEENAE
ncbi:MAG TPA: hypothetical protein VF767_01880 [Bryobacteraceae bacterium]